MDAKSVRIFTVNKPRAIAAESQTVVKGGNETKTIEKQ